MKTRSKSTLFLIEQLIVIAVFAICAAACISILAAAYFTAEETRDMGNALIVAESVAESFKAVNGDLRIVTRIVGGTAIYNHSVLGDYLIIYYDENWKISDETNHLYILTVFINENQSISSLLEGTLTVYKVQPDTGLPNSNSVDAEVILEFSVAARGGVSYE